MDELLITEKGWVCEGEVLKKSFAFESQTQLALFLLEIAKIADKMQHHPDCDIRKCSQLYISLTTHDAQKLTTLDWMLAKRIEDLFANI